MTVASMERRAGRVLYYGVMALAFMIMLILGAGTAIDADEPTYSGTFTEHSCTRTRHGCQSIGTWVSDDGLIARHSIALDGTTDANGTATARYTPTGFNNDRGNNIVHTRFNDDAKYWLFWVIAAVIATYVVLQARTWRRRDLRGERRAALKQLPGTHLANKASSASDR